MATQKGRLLNGYLSILGCSLKNWVFFFFKLIYLFYDLQVHGGNITFWVNIVVVKIPYFKKGSTSRETLFKYVCLRFCLFFPKFLNLGSRLTCSQTAFFPHPDWLCLVHMHYLILATAHLLLISELQFQLLLSWKRRACSVLRWDLPQVCIEYFFFPVIIQ